jgi:hypothetical protein
MNRRFFLFAAPAIVAAPSLMRVSTLALTTKEDILDWVGRVTATYSAPRTLFTNEMILREAMLHLNNTLVASKLVERDWKASEGMKVGDVITIARPLLRT